MLYKHAVLHVSNFHSACARGFPFYNSCKARDPTMIQQAGLQKDMLTAGHVFKKTC